MIKNPNKSQREVPVAPEETRHKKKSQSKGQPRSKHKHNYETVCLRYKYSLTKPHDPHPWKVDYHSATKVCTICGRVSGESDPAYYKEEKGHNNFGSYFTSKLIPEAYNLPRWVLDDMCGKFARREDDTNE